MVGRAVVVTVVSFRLKVSLIAMERELERKSKAISPSTAKTGHRCAKSAVADGCPLSLEECVDERSNSR